MLLSVVLFVLMVTAQASLQTDSEPENAGYIGKNRQKRAGVSVVGASVLLAREGLIALRRLLKGAKETRHNGFYSEYSKPGGYSQTKKDFDRAVDPATVQPFKLPSGIEGKVGYAGDRRLMAVSEEEYSGQAVLEITKISKHGNGNIHTIYYD